MANQDHLAIFQQGIESWNQWRQEHRDIHPDLSRIDITGAHLNNVRLSFSQLNRACFRGAQLHQAYFVNSDLSDADFHSTFLTEAHLDGAKLKRADLSGVRLQHAKIRIANLQGADLSGADLSFTNLDRTSFSHAHLHETNFYGAKMRFAKFFDVNPSVAKGLETVIHDGPSYLGIQTLSRSLKHLSAAFLQRAGVPASMLACARSVSEKASIYPTCFLRYASPDQPITLQLQADLQAHNLFCWSAPYDRPHEVKHIWRDVPLFIYDVFLLVISKHSMTEASHQAIQRLVKEALLKERRGSMPVLIPLSLEKDSQEMRGVWPKLLRLAQCPMRDFSHWSDQDAYQEALHHLLGDLIVV